MFLATEYRKLPTEIVSQLNAAQFQFLLHWHSQENPATEIKDDFRTAMICKSIIDMAGKVSKRDDIRLDKLIPKWGKPKPPKRMTDEEIWALQESVERQIRASQRGKQ